MPIYAYRCSACGHAKDVLQKLSDAPLTTCPACAAESFSKQVTAAGFQLKGSGWYATDFREGGGKKAEPATAPAASDGAKPAESSASRRPASRAAPSPAPAPAHRPPRRLPPPRAATDPDTPTAMLALRKWLFSGLLVIVPLFITLAVLKWIIDTLDQTLWVLPGAWQRWLYDNNIRGLGVLLTLAILLVVGAIASNFVGKRLLGWGDAVVRRIPVVRSIYSSVKQVSDTLFSENGNAFRTAVLVQWPA
jgi:putative FmdB family regulatory protein